MQGLFQRIVLNKDISLLTFQAVFNLLFLKHQSYHKKPDNYKIFY